VARLLVPPADLATLLAPADRRTGDPSRPSSGAQPDIVSRGHADASISGGPECPVEGTENGDFRGTAEPDSLTCSVFSVISVVNAVAAKP
jgi:hypothetical protein